MGATVNVPHIKIHLFGGLRVEVAGEDVTASLPGRKGRAVLAYLAARHPEGVTRDELVDILWPDARPTDPRANLRTLLSRIRDAVGPGALDNTSRSLALAASLNLDSDLARASAHVAAACADREANRAQSAVTHARAAVDILDRPLLPELEGEWLDRMRRTMDRDVGDMLSCIADMGSLAGGDLGEEAISAARELVEREGYLERSHRLLMLALARRGEGAEALRVYEGVRQQLLEELGTSPGPELQALHAAVLREEDLTVTSGRGPANEWLSEGLPLPPPVAAASDRVLIGRTSELSMIEEAEDGRTGRVITVSGPPGIGKSRLVTEAARRAGVAGRIVLFGRCDEGLAQPYQPFVEAIRHLLGAMPDHRVEALLGRTRGHLARILPEVAEGVSSPSRDEADTERHQLFEAVAGLLRQLAAGAPVLLVLDDLQWANRPTQLMLVHVERAVRDLDVSLLIAHRNTVADQSAGFGEMLAELRREREVTTVNVDILGAAEIRELVASELSQQPSDSLVELIQSRTGGNPLYARELARDLRLRNAPTKITPDGKSIDDWPVPEGIQQLVMRRLAGYPDGDRALILRGATLGRIVRPAELAAAEAVPFDAAMAALERATDAGLTIYRRSESGAFAFAHPLIREAIVANISPIRLGRMHLENAQRLELLWQGRELDVHLTDLAHHRIEAAVAGLERGTAVDWVERAADQAEHQLAYEAAADHYARALDLLETHPVARSRRVALLLRLAAAQWRSGNRDDSRATRRAAFEIAAQLDDAELMAEAAIGHERYFELNTFEADEDLMTREALARLPQRPTPRRAQLLARLSRINHSSGDPALTISVALEAVRYARQLNDPLVLADALNAVLLAYRAPGHPIHKRMEAASELIDIGRDLGSDERRLEGEAHRLLALVEGGRTTEIRTAVERFGRVVQGLQQPFWVYFRQAWAATFAFIEGDLEQAGRLADIATETAMGARSDAADGGAASTVQRMVEQGMATEVADLASQFVAEGIHDGVWRAGVVMVMARAGRTDEAHDLLAQLVDRDGIRLRHDVLWGMGACLLADAAHVLGAREAASTIYRELAPTPGWIAMAGSGRGFLLVSQRLGQLAQVLGEHSRALAHFAEARRQASDLSAGLLIAWADLESAATLLDRGAPADVARADMLLDSVQQFAQGRGLGLMEQRMRSLRRGVHLPGDVPA